MKLFLNPFFKLRHRNFRNELTTFYLLILAPFLLMAVNDDDPDFLIVAIKQVIDSWGPTKISQLVGGSKQKWASLENPTFTTLSHFLQAFELKIGAYDANESA